MLDKAVVDLSHWDEVDSFEDAKEDGVVGIILKATESNNYFDPTYSQREEVPLKPAPRTKKPGQRAKEKSPKAKPGGAPRKRA